MSSQEFMLRDVFSYENHLGQYFELEVVQNG